MQSTAFSKPAAESTSAGFNSSFAPFTTKMRFCPFGSTKIGPPPLDTPCTCLTWLASMPSFLKFSMVAGPNRSLPTRATIKTSAPQSLAAAAWLAPLPPNPRSNFCPKMVSPGLGKRSVNVVRSILALPTTAMRGRLAMTWEFLAIDLMPMRIAKVKKCESIEQRGLCQRKFRGRDSSVPVRYPDILHLHRVLQEPAAFALFHIEPVDGAAFVGDHLLEIAHRESLGRRRAGFVREAPDRSHVIVFGERFEKLRSVAGHNVDRAAGQIAGVEKLIKIARNQGISLRGNRDRRVAHRDHRHDQRQEPQQRRLIGTNDSNRANRFVHGDRDVAERGVVHRAVKLVCPGRIREDALNAAIHLGRSLSFADDGGQMASDFLAALRQIFRHVVEHLGTIVRRGPGPA